MGGLPTEFLRWPSVKTVARLYAVNSLRELMDSLGTISPPVSRSLQQTLVKFVDVTQPAAPTVYGEWEQSSLHLPRIEPPDSTFSWGDPGASTPRRARDFHVRLRALTDGDDLEVEDVVESAGQFTEFPLTGTKLKHTYELTITARNEASDVLVAGSSAIASRDVLIKRPKKNQGGGSGFDIDDSGGSTGGEGGVGDEGDQD